MKKNILIISIFLLFFSCEKGKNIDKFYEQTPDNQTRFLLDIDSKKFYEEDAVFNGHLEAKNNYFVMNFINQYGGNFILNLNGEEWFKSKSLEGRMYGAAASNLMIGKVIDKKANLGAGYLMYSGSIEPISVSQSKLIFKISGMLKKYPKVTETDPSYPFEGYIISKNPVFNEYSLKN